MACPDEGTRFEVQGEVFISEGRTSDDGRCLFRDQDGTLTVFDAAASTTTKPPSVGSVSKAAVVIGGMFALAAVFEHGID